MISGLNADEGFLFYQCEFSFPTVHCNLNVERNSTICLFSPQIRTTGIHYENFDRMKHSAFLRDQLVPAVMKSIFKANETQSIIQLMKQQYLGGINYADPQSFSLHFSKVTVRSGQK